MADIIRIAVPVPLFQAFDYAVPEGCPAPSVGARVRVPFRTKTAVGLCLAVDPKDAFADPKPLLEVLDQVSALPHELMLLAQWLASYYHHPIGEVFASMLPNAFMKGAPLKWRDEEIWRRVEGGEVPSPRAVRQQALLDFLAARGGWASGADVRAEGFSTSLIAALARKGAIEPSQRPYELEPPLPLTADQATAVQGYRRSLDGFSANLLEGVTGSGKTEVYLQVIAQVLERGEQALVLVPEIALTPQTVARFQRRCGAVDVMHSRLSDGERLKAWLRCQSGAARILVGTRSAVFTPFGKLGLMVVDEEHDASFKQRDRLRYSARDVAVKRAADLNIPLILGSATPSLESLENVRRGRYQRQRLTGRATGASMPRIHVLDVRGHPMRDGLSEALMRCIKQHLDAGGQVLVFLNRRGYAPVYLCTKCGWQAGCDDCDARLTLHRGRRRLACHHCGAEKRLPESCPACGNLELTPLGAGTERTEDALRERFPGVSLIRIDSDTTRTQRRLEAGLAQIERGEAGILVGTQMLAKGHHFPNVTLVAVVNADVGFLSVDFKAPERTAQLLTQVAGRAGRSDRPGVVWLQTLQPDNPALKRLVERGYAAFAAHELAVRRRAAMPPTRHMALIRAAAADPTLPSPFLLKLKSRLPSGLEVLGPAPAQMLRVADRYRHQLMVLADTRRPLHQALDRLVGVQAPRGVRWEIDVDPIDAI